MTFRKPWALSGSKTLRFLRIHFSRFIVFTLVSTSLVGCVQDSPPPSVEHTEALLIRLQHDESFEIRRTAAESLGKIGNEAAVDSVLPLVKDGNPIVRASAAWALGQLASSSREVVDVLGLALTDPEKSVRRAAALAIVDIEPGAGDLEPIGNLIAHANVGVRRAAAYALLQNEIAQWEPVLIAALKDPDVEVRQGLTAVLGASGSPGRTRVLRSRLLEDASPAVRIEAIYQVGRIDNPAIRRDLERLASNDPDDDVKRWAAVGLSMWHGLD